MAKLTFTKEQFDKAKDHFEHFYNTIRSVHCPYFGEHIKFNRKGREHIIFKRWNHARPQTDQYIRLKLIHLAPAVLKKSHTVQGYKITKHFEHVKVNSRWEQHLKDVEYHEFICVIQQARIRVVVKKVETGDRYFWSIIPYWKQSPYGKQMFEGDPEQD